MDGIVRGAPGLSCWPLLLADHGLEVQEFLKLSSILSPLGRKNMELGIV